MEILIINDALEVVGGAAQVAITTAQVFAERGYKVYFFTATAYEKALSLHPNVEVVSTSQFDILNDPNRFQAAIQGIWNYKAVKMLYRLLDRLNPATTIVHIHTWVKSLSPGVVRAVLARSFKVVCTLHDYFTACPTGSFYLHNKQTLCPHQPLGLDCVLENCDSRKYSHKLWRLSRSIAQKHIFGIPEGIRYFVAASNFSRKILQPYLATNAIIKTIYNPVDIVKSEPVKVGQNNQFIAVGRLAKEKGLDLFMHSAKHANIPAILIGDGEEREFLSRIYPDVLIVGWQSRDRVVDFLNNARALVFPSRWYESFGLVVAEALARGVPVIVPDANAAAELVQDGTTGLLFRSGDKNDLLCKIEKLYRSPELASQLGAQAYCNYWLAPLTTERYAAAIEVYYQQILSSP